MAYAANTTVPLEYQTGRAGPLLLTEDTDDDYGCEYCRNDGRLVDGRCPKCGAEYWDDEE
jgi:hypothetical protein